MYKRKKLFTIIMVATLIFQSITFTELFLCQDIKVYGEEVQTDYQDNIGEVTTASIEDTKFPAAPQNLIYKINTDNTVYLSWKEAANNDEIKEYEIYNGKELAYKTSDTHFTVTGLAANKPYVLTVKAKNIEGNLSEKSNSVEVKLTNLVSTELIEPAITNDGYTSYPSITMEDSDDFIIVKQDTQVTESIKVVGLDSGYIKHDFTDAEKDYITWTTSDSSVVKFESGSSTVSSMTGVDQATLKTMGEGTATVIITYDTPEDDPVSIKCYVTVEGDNYVRNVSVEAKECNTKYCSKTNLTIKFFDLKDIFGKNFDDSNVLKNRPSVIHALLYALELQNDPDRCTDVDDANWDWDWVSANVQLGSQGSYVLKIGDDYYWEYYLNDQYGTYAPSATALSYQDEIRFEKFRW